MHIDKRLCFIKSFDKEGAEIFINQRILPRLENAVPNSGSFISLDHNLIIDINLSIHGLDGVEPPVSVIMRFSYKTKTKDIHGSNDAHFGLAAVYFINRQIKENKELDSITYLPFEEFRIYKYNPKYKSYGSKLLVNEDDLHEFTEEISEFLKLVDVSEYFAAEDTQSKRYYKKVKEFNDSVQAHYIEEERNMDYDPLKEIYPEDPCEFCRRVPCICNVGSE